MKLPWSKGKDKSLGLFHAEAATSSLENAGIAYQSPSVIAAGANASGVALLSTLTHLVLSVFLLRVPSLIDNPRHSIRKTVVIFALVNTFTWVPIVFVMVFLSNVSPLLLTGLWIVNLVPAVLMGPLRDSWLANIVPGGNMGRYLSLRAVVAGGAYLASYYAMGFILDATTTQKSNGYAVILIFALLASITTAFFYTNIKPPPAAAVKDKEPNLGFLSFLKHARRSHLGVFILFVSMFTFAVNLSGPLFTSYMLHDLKFTYITFVAIISFEYIARIISLTFWGRMVDRSGSLKVIGMVTYLIPFIPIFWLFSGNILYLCAIQAFAGIVWAAFDLGVQTFIYKATAPAQRLRYIVYHKALTSFSVALGALAGALLVNNVVPLFGNRILTLFLVSGILRMVIARVMLPKLTPEGIPGALIHEELAQELSALEVPVFSDGLYYHPEAWGRFSRRAYIIGNSIGKTIGKLNPVKPGLFYQPNRWAKYVTPTARDITAKETVKGLYNDPKSWNGYMNQKGNVPVPVKTVPQTVREGLYYRKNEWLQKDQPGTMAKNSNKSTLEKKGLFHNPEHWLDYLKQGMVLNATTAQNASGTVLRQPVFYHPEAWDRYKKETTTVNSKNRHSADSRRPLLYHPEDWKQFRGTPVSGTPQRVAVPVTANRYHPPTRLPVRPQASPVNVYGRYKLATVAAR